MQTKFTILMAALLLAAMPAPSQAQDGKKLPQIYEITELYPDDDDKNLEVFYMLDGDQRNYYLSVGHLGFGGKVVQLNLDPVNVLCLHLGTTLDEAISQLEQLKDLCKQPKGSQLEMDGYLGWAFPRGESERVTVTHIKPLLTHLLEFALQHDGHLRYTQVAKSDINSLIGSVKLYRKLHPKEQ